MTIPSSLRLPSRHSRMVNYQGENSSFPQKLLPDCFGRRLLPCNHPLRGAIDSAGSCRRLPPPRFLDLRVSPPSGKAARRSPSFSWSRARTPLMRGIRMAALTQSSWTIEVLRFGAKAQEFGRRRERKDSTENPIPLLDWEGRPRWPGANPGVTFRSRQSRRRGSRGSRRRAIRSRRSG